MTRVVVLSDLNESYGSTRYSKHVDQAIERTTALKPDLAISTGDAGAGQRLAPSRCRPFPSAMYNTGADALPSVPCVAGLVSWPRLLTAEKAGRG